jgi:peptidoglycan/LPS O-acetylase OafA/YrhL
MKENAKIHLPGLNGIRAIAAFAVIFSHIGLSLSSFGMKSLPDIDLAGYGVTIFFALSGFLITYLLLIEKERFSGIQIRQFYIRRMLRIWPLYYLYIGLALLAVYLWPGDEINYSYLPFTIFFSANVPMILAIPMGLLGHFWSLGVEEQFYAFWPWVADRVKNLARWIIVFVVLVLVLKILAWLWWQRTGNLVPYSIIHVTRFHCMAIGALGAILFFNKNADLLRIAYHPATQVICWISVALLGFNLFPLPSVIKHEVVAIIAVGLIVNVAGNARTLIKLTGLIPDYLGKISFGLYVYHPLVIYILGRFAGELVTAWPETLRLIFAYVLIPLLTILVAGFSYDFFEKRFLRLKHSYSRVVSQASER